MIAMMERYTNNLEDIVTERTEQLQEEKRKTDALLYRMLPKLVCFSYDFQTFYVCSIQLIELRKTQWKSSM